MKKLTLEVVFAPMNFVDDEIIEYCETYSKPGDVVLQQLERETHLKVLMPQMIAGNLQGQLLRMMSEMIRPSAILEIGTFTGYSAICFASGLKEGGILHTIEVNDELQEMITRYFDKAGFSKKIHLHIGNALEIIPSLHLNFDLVFIDADKENYPAYYDLVFDKLKSGGYIIADNALWGGKVINDRNDSETVGIHEFNKKVTADKRVENLLLPVRDGIMIIRKL